VAQRDLFIDTQRREVVLSATDSSIAVLPGFTQGDSLDLRVFLLKDYSRTGSYTRIPVEGLTIQAALGTKIGSETLYYTQQFTWAASTDMGQPYFSAIFPMNTDAITELVGVAAQATAYFEIKMISSGLPVTVLSKLITCHAAVIKEGGLTVPAGQTPLSVEVANATYLQRIIDGSIFLRHPATGKMTELYTDADGAFHADPVL